MGGHSAVTLSVRLSHEVSLFMFQMVEARARTAFVMAYNPALVHLVPTGAPYRTNAFGRAPSLQSSLDDGFRFCVGGSYAPSVLSECLTNPAR